MPFLWVKVLIFQGSTHQNGVGSLSNILYQFEDEGLIEKTEEVWRILDWQGIIREARQVLDFMGEED